MAKVKGKGTAGGGPSRVRRYLFARPVMFLVLLLGALALLFYFRNPVSSGLDSAGDALLDTFGVGLVLLILVALILLAWLAWGRRFTDFLQRGNQRLARVFSSFSGRRWNRWMAVVVFALAFFGLLAFFDIGGSLGRAIVGGPDALGALRFMAMVFLGIALIAPARSWHLLKRLGPGLAYLCRRYRPHIYLQRAAVWVGNLRPRRAPLPIPSRPAAKPRMPREAPAEAATPSAVDTADVPVAEEVPVERGVVGDWQMPSIGLLERIPEGEPVVVDTERGSKIIEDALASYGVEAKVVQVNVGPAVTQYGVEPGWDRKFKEVKEKDRDGNINVRLEEVSKTRVKVDRIASLANDLALALSAPSIKIEAPIPGKAMVGIEVPNPVAGSTSLRGIIETPPFQKLLGKTKLPMALGKGVSGEGVVGDLAKMPHLLIAGATGSGKSVCMKAIITTFLLQASPDEVRFLLIDPKRVELVSFGNVPHLLAPVIVDREKAVAILKWLEREMDHRYDRLAEVGARDIDSYNKSPRAERPLSYILLVIDELADLMATAPDEVERIICRLAQLSRATGIHLVVATQRPSVDVVTGLIKANFPARISFAVASQVDSRTILDAAGAEKLLGRGDMLFLPPDAPKPKRLQGSFVSEAEIERVVSFWISQQPAEAIGPQLEQELDKVSVTTSSEDALLQRAKELALEHRRISTSFLQRRLGIGYPRAARIMDMLEEQGVVAIGEPGKSREVLKGDEGREADVE